MNDVLQGKELQSLVIAPIIAEAHTQEGVQPFLDFVHKLEGLNSTQTAAAETDRLQPYFVAMSSYLAGVITRDCQSLSRNAQELQELTTPESLSGIFNAMAAKTRATMTSDVAILPDNISKTGPAEFLFRGKNEFSTDYNYRGYRFNFGFFQVRQKSDDAMVRSSTVFPTFVIDHRALEAVPAAQREPLLQDFQKVMTFVNHDMLHHLTSPVINTNTLPRLEADGSAFMKWMGQLPHTGSARYEDWAQMGHERVLLSEEDPAQVEEIRATLDSYFDKVARLGEAQEDNKKVAPDAVDFFGMLMAHVLTRLYPLNHPLMTHCMERLEQVDLDPRRAREVCREAITPNPRQSIRQAVAAGLLQEVVDAYRDVGFDLLPEKEEDMSYKQLKLLALTRVSHGEVVAHMPADKSRMKDLRNSTDWLTVNLVKVAAKWTGFTPQG